MMRDRRPLRVRLTLVVVIISALMAVACGDGGDGDASEPTTEEQPTAPTASEPTTEEQPTATAAATEQPTATTATTATVEQPTEVVSEDPVEVEFPVPVAVVTDVAYTSERMLDVYVPAEGSGWPVVVYFHGGRPAPGIRAAASARLQAIAEQGVIVYAPDWRSVGPAGGSQDTVCAIAYAEATAADHGGQGDAVTVAGYSTGGFTALVHGLLGPDAPLAVTDCEVDPDVGVPDAIAVGGTPVFVAEWARDGRIAQPAWIALTPEQLDLFDPYLLLGRNPDAIVALAVGEDDQGGPAAPPGGWPITDANLDFYQRLIDAGYDATLRTFPGGHVIEAGSEQEAALVEMIVDVARSTTAE